jgi:hypothetical protein
MELSEVIVQEDFKPESSHVVTHGRAATISSRCSQAFLFGDKMNCHPGNIKTLCTSCHTKADWGLKSQK